MGRLYKRGNIWWIRYYRNGKCFPESSGSTQHAVAKSLLKLREGEGAKGVPVTPMMARFTFDEAARDLEREYAANGRRSLDSVERRIRKHLLPFLGGRRMAGITTVDVRRYTEQRQIAGAKNATINRELAALKRMFTLARRAGILAASPFIPMLAENNVRKGFFEREQFDAVCAHLAAPVQAVVTFAYLTGWRGPSEVLTLQWRQVDLVAGVLRLEPGTTKNNDARVFPFDVFPELRELLHRQRAITDAVEKANGKAVPWVFHRDGRPIRTYQTAWKSACEAAGCPGLVPHDFRRTAVRNMSRAGLPDTVSMKLTGHKTRSVFDRYNVTAESDLRNGVALLAATMKRTIQGTIDRTRRLIPIRSGDKIRRFAKESNGAGGGGRTHTQLPVRDFESRASASSATPAGVTQNSRFGFILPTSCADGWWRCCWCSERCASGRSRIRA